MIEYRNGNASVQGRLLTLVLEEGEWKVFQIVEIVAPAALGKEAYSGDGRLALGRTPVSC